MSEERNDTDDIALDAAHLVEVLWRRFPPHDDRLRPLVTTLADRSLRDHVALDLGAADDTALGVARSELATALAASTAMVEVVGRETALELLGPPVVCLDDRYLYLRRRARAEERVATALRHAATTTVPLPGAITRERFDDELKALLAESPLEMPEFAELAERCLTRRISIITGGPGTGKTTRVAELLRLLARCLDGEGPSVDYVLAAPTGKAAQRLNEGIRVALRDTHCARLLADAARSGSVHRLLGMRPDVEQRPKAVGHDLVIVDEASMADLDMWDLLLQATDAANDQSTTRIIVLGDPHQLASVNVGAVLNDVVDGHGIVSELITRLHKVHRTDAPDILGLADAINADDVDRVRTILKESSDVDYITSATDEHLLATVAAHAGAVGEVAQTGDGAHALALLRQLMVLSAHRRGRGSVSWWNTAINDSFHASFPPVGGARFGVGEAVLVTRNQDHLGVFNGDVGVVILCDDIVTLYFDEERSFPLAMVGHLETAWALTIHKSQGSEYDHVVVVLPEKDSQILTRELLYTGVTRAKQHVTIAGSLEAIEAAVRSPITRVSGLTYRLSTT